MKFRDFTKYEVFEDGRIYSYKSKKFLKPITMKDGYQRVNLYDNDGKMKRYQLHRVVYEAVSCEEIPEGMQCNHISEDKTDCSFANLNLLSPKQNCNWGSRNTRIAKSLSKQVGAFKDGKLVMTFQSTQEAERNGFNKGNVASCCRNCYLREGNNKYKGFEWKYI